MASIAERGNDDATLLARLGEWLQTQKNQAPGIQITNLTRNPSNGFSNDTILLETQNAGQLGRIVVRIPPRVNGLLPEANLQKQAWVQTLMANEGVTAVAPIAYESDVRWIGDPFIAMPFVAGRVASDEPHYSQQGWLFDLPAAAQRQLYGGVLGELAKIHRVDPRKAPFLGQPAAGTAKSYFQSVCKYVSWASNGEIPPVVADTIQWCDKHLPLEDSPPSILWGDARIGNMIFGENLAPAAVLDWEATSIGPAEIDVGYFLSYGRRNRERFGNKSGFELPGFFGRDEAISFYESRLGRKLKNLQWYEISANVLLAGYFLRARDLMRQRGQVNHFVMTRPIIQEWVLEEMAALSAAT